MTRKLALAAAATSVLAIAILFGAGQTAHAQSASEHIASFDVKVAVDPDASAKVSESIRYDFGSAQRHGIYRDIPVKYAAKDGSEWDLSVSGISVTDERGSAYAFTTKANGKYERIQIGDADRTITGEHVYDISYTVDRPIGYFEGFDEIYWNAVGTEWTVPVSVATAEVSIPYSVSSAAQFKDEMRVSCYAGAQGSDKACDSTSSSYASGTPTVIKFAQKGLAAHEGLTVAVGFPKGVVAVPTAAQAAQVAATGFIAEGWLWFLLPVAVFAFMFRRWSRYGRDPRGTGVIIPHYESPDGLSPMQIHFLLKQGFGGSVSAEIIYLATQGFIRINRIGKDGMFSSADYELVKLKAADSSLTDFQTELLENLFASKAGAFTGQESVLVSSLRLWFYKIVAKVQGLAAASLVTGGYIDERGKFDALSMWSSARGGSRAIGVATLAVAFMIFGGSFIAGHFGAFDGNPAGVKAMLAFFPTVMVWAVFTILMPRLTEKGVAAKEAVKGFKLYLSVAEKDRLEFHNAPAKNPQIFEKLLPYAVALGVEKEWAKAFEGIELPAPSWYSDPSMRAFNAGIFASNMRAFALAGQSALTSAPGTRAGSGGGGFSGGGGGGGGGGSW